MKRKIYENKSKCYECNAEGHLSYQCPLNTLGIRQPTPSKKKRKHKHHRDRTYSRVDDEPTASDSEDDQQLKNSRLETLEVAIRMEVKYPPMSFAFTYTYKIIIYWPPGARLISYYFTSTRVGNYIDPKIRTWWSASSLFCLTTGIK